MYYDKKGKELSLLEWARLLEDNDYRVVKQTKLSNDYFVSTVWLGLNYNFKKGKPLIFETMVFYNGLEGSGDSADFCQRYSTLKEALVGHKKAINKFKKL